MTTSACDWTPITVTLRAFFSKRPASLEIIMKVDLVPAIAVFSPSPVALHTVESFGFETATTNGLLGISALPHWTSIICSPTSHGVKVTSCVSTAVSLMSTLYCAEGPLASTVSFPLPASLDLTVKTIGSPEVPLL